VADSGWLTVTKKGVHFFGKYTLNWMNLTRTMFFESSETTSSGTTTMGTLAKVKACQRRVRGEERGEEKTNRVELGRIKGNHLTLSVLPIIGLFTVAL
jgi:hypothetical protein